jgi:tetratricopeptide (TPR) repeat protein
MFTPSYGNLSAALLALDRYDDARAVLKQAADLKLDFIGARRLSYLLAFVQGDTATMERELAQSVGPRETNSAFGWQAHTSAFGGRVAAAHEQFRLGIRLALQGRFNEVAGQLTLEDAENHAILGDCQAARTEADSGIEMSRDNGTLERASRVFAMCGDAQQATAMTTELAKRFPEATLTVRVFLPVTAAIVASERGQPAQAVQLLDSVKPYDHAPSAEFWPAYQRGQAYLQLRDANNAAANFRSIIDHRGEVPASVFYPLAHLGLARTMVMTNDVAGARQAYQTFFTLWKDADPELAPLKQARAESARLDAAGDAVNTAR